MTKFSKQNKGFTMIELITVIAIIAVLSTIVVVGVSSSRSKSRDAKRISELNLVKDAIQGYYGQNFQYPSSAGADCEVTWQAPYPYTNTLYGACFNGVSNTLGDYLGQRPVAPSPRRSVYYSYAYSMNFTTYRVEHYWLWVGLEKSQNASWLEGSTYMYMIHDGVQCFDKAACSTFSI